jgi:hypothetical protein
MSLQKEQKVCRKCTTKKPNSLLAQGSPYANVMWFRNGNEKMYHFDHLKVDHPDQVVKNSAMKLNELVKSSATPLFASAYEPDYL